MYLFTKLQFYYMYEEINASFPGNKLVSWLLVCKISV